VLLLPVVIVVLAGLTAGEYLTFPPQGLSLRWVVDFLQSPTYFPAYLFSLELALITMAISSVMGTMAAIYLIRSKAKFVAAMRGLFMAPIVLPGLVLGLALYVFYVTTNIGLARTFGGLLVGHVLVTTPFVLATVSAVPGIPPHHVEDHSAVGRRRRDFRIHHLVRAVRPLALSRDAESDRAALCDVYFVALQV
jgi:putative spermidine/putrescine transport system permease protein